MLGADELPEYFGVGGIFVSHPDYEALSLRPPHGTWEVTRERVGAGEVLGARVSLGTVPLSELGRDR